MALIREASDAALASSDRLYELISGGTEDRATPALLESPLDVINEAAAELRRHALWLRAAADLGTVMERPAMRLVGTGSTSVYALLEVEPV
jgi:hypothetical protein